MSADGRLAAHRDVLLVLKVLFRMAQPESAELCSTNSKVESTWARVCQAEVTGPGRHILRANVVHVLGSFDGDASGLADYPKEARDPPRDGDPQELFSRGSI